MIQMVQYTTREGIICALSPVVLPLHYGDAPLLSGGACIYELLVPIHRFMWRLLRGPSWRWVLHVALRSGTTVPARLRRTLIAWSDNCNPHSEFLILFCSLKITLGL